jgi:hypothetical protein
LLGAQEAHQANPRSSRANYVAGELIVKLRSDAGEALDGALNNHKPPIETGLSWFDALNRQHGVTAIKPLFANQPSPEEIKRKYPVRSRRAPPGAKATSLKHIYQLTMRVDVDIEQAARAYAAHVYVEYAQPNYLSTIQQSALSETSTIR